MTYAWATWLQDALESDPFVKERLLIEPGWKTRGRPGSFLPTGHVEHHTACMMRIGHDPAVDLAVNLKGNSIAPGPISQLLGTFTPPGTRWTGKNTSPRLIIIAAGKANHAGQSQFPWDPAGPGGNALATGTEWCGPPDVDWPDEVIELRARSSAAILRWNGWGIHQLTTHWECARPIGRKIDPSGGWSEEPDLGQLSHWTPDKWRGFVVPFINLPSAPVVPPVNPQTPIVINPVSEGDSEVSYEILDYGIRPGSAEGPSDWWWTEFGITSRGLCWSGAPREVDVPSNVYHFMAEATAKKPMLRIKDDTEMMQWIQRLGTTGPVPSTFALNPTLTAYWQQYSNDKK